MQVLGEFVLGTHKGRLAFGAEPSVRVHSLSQPMHRFGQFEIVTGLEQGQERGRNVQVTGHRTELLGLFEERRIDDERHMEAVHFGIVGHRDDAMVAGDEEDGIGEVRALAVLVQELADGLVRVQ